MSIVALKTGTIVAPEPLPKRLQAYYRRHAFAININTLIGLFLIVGQASRLGSVFGPGDIARYFGQLSPKSTKRVLSVASRREVVRGQ